MAEAPYDDPDSLNREIDRLWAKVGSSSVHDSDLAPTPVLADASVGKQLAWETVALLKRHHRNESVSWGELLEAKEEALKVVKQRMAALEAENAALRERVQADASQLVQESTRIQGQLEAAMRSFEDEGGMREEESRSLRALLDQMRQRLSAEDGRWKEQQRQWEKREQQLLLDIRELQAFSARRQEETGQSSDQARRMAESLKEAKNALEKTLAELLRERQRSQQSEQETARSRTKMEESEQHLQELSKLWEEERAQWRELWDRERSTWETQRQEFSTWEQRLRQEREAWHMELKAKENDALRYTDQMTRALRETGELSLRIGEVMRGQRRGPWGLSRRSLALLFLAGMLAAASPFAWRQWQRHRFAAVSTQAVQTAAPTALAFDGTLLWLSSWEGRLVAYDPDNLENSVRSAAPSELAPYHPISMAFGGESLWTLDAAQARQVRHQASDPAKVVSIKSTPGPAPTALAFDGQSLWSFDAVNRALYRHEADESGVKAFSLDSQLVATAMTWVDGHLWVFDAKSRQLWDFSFADSGFKLVEKYPFEEPVSGLAAGTAMVDGRRRAQLWTLAGPTGARQSPALIKYGY